MLQVIFQQTSRQTDWLTMPGNRRKFNSLLLSIGTALTLLLTYLCYLYLDKVITPTYNGRNHLFRITGISCALIQNTRRKLEHFSCRSTTPSVW